MVVDVVGTASVEDGLSERAGGDIGGVTIVVGGGVAAVVSGGEEGVGVVEVAGTSGGGISCAGVSTGGCSKIVGLSGAIFPVELLDGPAGVICCASL